VQRRGRACRGEQFPQRPIFSGAALEIEQSPGAGVERVVHPRQRLNCAQARLRHGEPGYDASLFRLTILWRDIQDLPLLLGRLGGHEHDRRVAVAASIDSAEALHHALPGDDVRHGMVGVKVDSHFGGGRCDQKSSRAGLPGLPGEKAALREPSGRGLPFVDPAPAHEQVTVDGSLSLLGLGSKLFPDLLRILAAVAEHHATN
jgi:hypothetical protein